MKLIKPIVYAGVSFLLMCSPATNSKKPLRVAVAANLRFVMEEVNVAFEKETGIGVEMVTASSGKLTAQIKSGAPYDVFLSANFKYPNSLYRDGYAKSKPVLFCKGTLVAWTNKSLVPDSTLANLTDTEIKKIGIANPQNAPYGIAAEELLKKLGLYSSIKSKLVFAENVSQLNQYVLNNAVDLAITAKSAVLSSKLKGIGEWKEIDTINYSVVKQYFVELKSKKNANVVEKYLDFFSSHRTEEILNKYGYFVK
jgi:molybdate transport system substrate-binding protein